MVLPRTDPHSGTRRESSAFIQWCFQNGPVSLTEDVFEVETYKMVAIGLRKTGRPGMPLIGKVVPLNNKLEHILCSDPSQLPICQLWFVLLSRKLRTSSFLRPHFVRQVCIALGALLCKSQSLPFARFQARLSALAHGLAVAVSEHNPPESYRGRARSLNVLVQVLARQAKELASLWGAGCSLSSTVAQAVIL